MMSDLRFVLRAFSRAPGFVAVTVFTLALGLGAAAAIYTVADWVLFRANRLPEDLVLVGCKDKLAQFIPVRIDAEVRAFRELGTVFSDQAQAAYQPANVALEGDPIASSTLGVTPNLLGMFGVAPAVGRGFLPGEDVEGRNDALVLSDEFAKQHFQSPSAALGRKLTVGGSVCTVVGVLPAGVVLPAYFYAQVYRPLAYRVDPAMPWDPQLFVIARLRPGVTLPQAENAANAIRVAHPPAFEQFFANRVTSLETMRDLQKLMRPEIYWVLVGAVGFLYAIACLNAANLMLVRMLGRKRELSIRLALGGGRWRLIRLLGLESLLLAGAGAAIGILIANWLVPLFMALSWADGRFAWKQWSLSWPALAVLAGLTLTTALVITLVPTLRLLKPDVQEGLKEGGAALGESRNLARLRGALVVLQAAFAVVLLAGAGLMVRTFDRLQEVPLGFAAHHRVKAVLAFPAGYVTGKEERLALLKRLQDHLRRVPGVQSASYGIDLLLPGYFFAGTSVLLADGTPINVAVGQVSPDFLETAGIALKRGRVPDPAAGAEIMINEAFARVRYPNQDPVGQFLKPVNSQGDWKGWLVVGVVGDVRETLRGGAGYRVYGPETWFPPNMNAWVVQTAREPDAALIGTLKRAVYAFDPRIVINDIRALSEVRRQQLGYERFVSSVLKVLSVIAFTLTLVGLFSVIAYTVDRRMNEFGIRLALGATPRDLAGLVVRRGLALALVGVVAGAGGAVALARFLRSLLYETPAYDPAVLLGVGLLLLAAGGLACVLPALRATRADVVRLLRSE